MIEQGIVMRVAAALGADIVGGYKGSLPKDAQLPSWTYRVISDSAQIGLLSPTGLSRMMLEINCISPFPAPTISMAASIKSAINGFKGTLPDPDSTYVDSCFLSDQMDFEQDEDSRNQRRMIEFTLWYAQ